MDAKQKRKRRRVKVKVPHEHTHDFDATPMSDSGTVKVHLQGKTWNRFCDLIDDHYTLPVLQMLKNACKEVEPSIDIIFKRESPRMWLKILILMVPVTGVLIPQLLYGPMWSWNLFPCFAPFITTCLVLGMTWQYYPMKNLHVEMVTFYASMTEGGLWWAFVTTAAACPIFCLAPFLAELGPTCQEWWWAIFTISVMGGILSIPTASSYRGYSVRYHAVLAFAGVFCCYSTPNLINVLNYLDGRATKFSFVIALLYVLALISLLVMYAALNMLEASEQNECALKTYYRGLIYSEWALFMLGGLSCYAMGWDTLIYQDCPPRLT